MNCEGGDRQDFPLFEQLPRPLRNLVRTAGFPLLAAAVTAVVFCSVTGFEQLPLDDHAYLHDHLAWNSGNLVRNLSEPVLKLFTPLVSLSFMLDHLLWSDMNFGSHLSNLLLHLAGTLALYSIGRELGLRRAAAFFCSLAWAVSPQRVESVAWLAERKDVLLGACFLGGLWHPGWIVFVGGAAVCALLDVIGKPVSHYSGAVMLSAVTAYLLLGFLGGLWHPGWVVFLGGAAVCAALGATEDALRKKKEK